MAKPEDEALARTEILLRDAENDLQQERLQELWRQWGGTLIGMALMLIIGTASGVVWRDWQKSKNEKATASLFQMVTGNTIVIGPETESELGKNHASIAYMSKAGALIAENKTSAIRDELAKLYAAASRTGDNTTWGWLARWNELRLQMDDEKSDAAKLLKNYEDLANERKGTGLSALALTDAAVIAGERLKDPARALEYVAAAEKVVGPTTPMASILSDLKHLYTVRAQSLKEGESQ